MDKIITIQDIKDAVNIVAPKYDLKKVILFGSYATGKNTQNSDVDLLVEFNDESIVSLFTISGLQYDLEEITGKNVDVIPLTAELYFDVVREVLLYGA